MIVAAITAHSEPMSPITQPGVMLKPKLRQRWIPHMSLDKPTVSDGVSGARR
jgi:hypothetical protein